MCCMRTSFRLINLPDLSTQASLGEDILKLIFDEESADVAFLVKGQMFYAHRQILKAFLWTPGVLGQLWIVKG